MWNIRDDVRNVVPEMMYTSFLVEKVLRQPAILDGRLLLNKFFWIISSIFQTYELLINTKFKSFPSNTFNLTWI